MTMNLVGQQKLFEVPSSMKIMDEDIVYSVTEKCSRKASEPTTTRSSTTSSLIFLKTLEIFSLRFFYCSNFPNFLNSLNL